jgi:molecular chaperone DnaK
VGAGIQAGVLAGEVKDLLLLDVTPLSLGIETLGGVMTRLIQRNTTIPTRKSEFFTTAADNQTTVEVHVLQGEREMAQGNRTLGRFQLVGIPPAPRGLPKIEVTFDIDANGIVHVSAKDTGTGKEQKITITASSGLSKEEVERMMREAESHADEDKHRREVVDERNRADGLIYQIEKTLAENRARLSADEIGPVESAMTSLRQAMQGDDLAAIRAGIDELQRASHKMAERLYQQSGAQGSAGEGAAGAASPGGEPEAQAAGSGTGDVVEGEVVDEGKKA